MSVQQTPGELQRQMAQLRSDVQVDVGEVIDRAEELTDWRYYVERHPWICVSAAAVIGYLLVPPRYEIVSPDAKTLLKLAERNRLVVEANPDPVPRGGLLGRVLGTAGRLLIREALSYAGRRVGQAFEQPRHPKAKRRKTAHAAK